MNSTQKETLLAYNEHLCLNFGMKTMPILFRYENLKSLYPNKDGFHSFLKRGLKKEKFVQIKKGLYALVDPSTGHIYADKFQIASSLFNDSYISYHDALEYYGLATQVHISRLTYIAKNHVKDLEVDKVTFSSKKETCSLEVIDTTKENGVRVVSIERAIIDSIDSISLGGGLDEVENALDMVHSLNIDKIIKLLEYYDKSFLYQKVGYLFEKHFKDEIPESFYQLCLKNIGLKKMYFETIPGRSKFIAKWHLLVSDESGLPDELF